MGDAFTPPLLGAAAAVLQRRRGRDSDCRQRLRLAPTAEDDPGAIVYGSVRTRPAVWRALLAPARCRDLSEAERALRLESIKQRLESCGVFHSVDVGLGNDRGGRRRWTEVLSGYWPGRRRGVRVSVRERGLPGARVFSSVDATGDVSLDVEGQLRNVAGLCDTLAVSVSPGESFGGWKANMKYSVPMPSMRPVSGVLQLGYGQDDFVQFSSYAVKRSSAQGFVSVAAAGALHSVGVRWERRRMARLDRAASPTIRRMPSVSDKSSLVWDVEPYAKELGLSMSWHTELASRLLGGDVDFVKVEGLLRQPLRQCSGMDAVLLTRAGVLLTPPGDLPWARAASPRQASAASAAATVHDRFFPDWHLRGITPDSIGPHDRQDAIGTKLYAAPVFYAGFPLLQATRDFCTGHVFASGLALRGVGAKICGMRDLRRQMELRASVGLGLTLNLIVTKFDVSFVKTFTRHAKDERSRLFFGLSVE